MKSPLPVLSAPPRFALEPDQDYSAGVWAEKLSSAYGLTPDPWQRMVLDHWLGERVDGKWSAATCGLAVPRQNGKNAVIEVAELYKMVTLGRRVLHTAHLVPTARKAFLRLCSFFENERDFPDLAKLVLGAPRKANGQESITLRNGGSFELVARTNGAGRGFTADDLVLDEAQHLSPEDMAALLPTISAAPSGNPQIIYTGTPPAPGMAGDVWLELRTQGVNRSGGRLSWHEWSVLVPPEVRTLDQLKAWSAKRSLWEAVNPALGTRIGYDEIETMWDRLTPDAFARECLGVWPLGSHDRVISSALWLSRKVEETPTGRRVYALDMSENRSRWALSVAVQPVGGPIHLEVARDSSTGVDAGSIEDWIVGRRPSPIVIDRDSPAFSLVPALKRRGVKVIVTGHPEMAQACGLLFDAVRDGTVSHFGQQPLDDALGMARKRDIGQAGRWVWDRRSPDDDITPLVSVTLALFGAVSSKRAPGAIRRSR